MRKIETGIAINMTPMIDVIFQLFIFFMVTLDMQNQQIEMGIKLAMAPHGKALEQSDPRTINIDVDTKGRIFIAKTWISLGTLRQVLRKAVTEYGQTVPIVVRGDGNAIHRNVKSIMDACSSAGLSQIRFAAIKEKQTE